VNRSLIIGACEGFVSRGRDGPGGGGITRLRRPNRNGPGPADSPRRFFTMVMTRGLLACPVSQQAVRDVLAAWSCCRQLSEMCDCPIVAAPMASPPALVMVRGACLSLWTTGHGGGGACREDVNGVQRGCKCVCSVNVGPQCPQGTYLFSSLLTCALS
jgi:hypothetical protein